MDRFVRKPPPNIEGYGDVVPYDPSRRRVADGNEARVRTRAAGESKLLRTIGEAFAACQVRDGDTLSFHHHLRNGDQVLNQVLAVAADRGLRNLTIAPSSLFPVHEPLVRHLRSGVVTRVYTAYMSGPVADAISHAVLQTPVVMQTHGGRARAIESGALPIDVAFIAAP